MERLAVVRAARTTTAATNSTNSSNSSYPLTFIPLNGRGENKKKKKDEQIHSRLSTDVDWTVSNVVGKICRQTEESYVPVGRRALDSNPEHGHAACAEEVTIFLVANMNTCESRARLWHTLIGVPCPATETSDEPLWTDMGHATFPGFVPLMWVRLFRVVRWDTDALGDPAFPKLFPTVFRIWTEVASPLGVSEAQFPTFLYAINFFSRSVDSRIYRELPKGATRKFWKLIAPSRSSKLCDEVATPTERFMSFKRAAEMLKGSVQRREVEDVWRLFLARSSFRGEMLMKNVPREEMETASMRIELTPAVEMALTNYDADVLKRTQEQRAADEERRRIRETREF